MKRASAHLCLCAAAIVMTCAKSNNPTGPGGPDNTITMTYTVSGNTIIVSQPQRIYTSTHCNGNTLVTTYDTSDASTDTSQFVLLNNDNLLVVNGTDSMVRVGTGSGIQGQWTVPGTTGISIVIGAGTITVSGEMNDYDYADSFIQYWQSQLYNITVAKTSSNTVSLTGKTSSEVVTITWNSAGDQTYTSSNTANAAGVYYENPTACPNKPPAWYGLFLAANRLVAKTAAVSPEAAPHGLPALFTKWPFHHR